MIKKKIFALIIACFCVAASATVIGCKKDTDKDSSSSKASQSASQSLSESAGNEVEEESSSDIIDGAEDEYTNNY